MRKIITLIFSLILVLSLTVSTGWGASGSYSPGQPPIVPPAEPEQKGEEFLPAIDVTIGSTQEGWAIIYSEKDKAIKWVKIIVTPVADRFITPYEDIEEMLDRAYKQVLGVESATELTKELQPYVKEDRKLVISDLFDVSVKGSDEKITQEYLARAGYTIRFKLRLPIKTGEFWLPLHNYEGNKWRIVTDRSAVKDVVTLRVDSLSPFAIVRESMGSPEDEPGKDEPGKDKPGKDKPTRPVGPVKPGTHSGSGEGETGEGTGTGSGSGEDNPSIGTGTDVPGYTTGTDKPTTDTDIHEHHHKGEHCMCNCTGLLPCCLCWIKGFIIGVIITALICIVVIMLLGRKARKEREKRQELERQQKENSDLNKQRNYSKK